MTRRRPFSFASLLLATTAVVLATGSHVSGATLDALWEFEETGGTNAADSVAAHPLDIILSPDLNVAGQFGSGIDFGTDANARGVGNNAGTKTATQPAGDFTVLTWINPVASDLNTNSLRFIDTSSNNGAITTGYRLFTGGGADSDNFRFLGDGASGNTGIVHARALSVGQWQMLAVRYDIDGSATVNVLRDNDLVDAAFVAANNESTSATGAIHYAASESPNFATMDSPNGTQNFNGLMDDAAFFNGILTDRQIANAFQSGAANAFGFALANYDFQSDGSVTSTAPLVVADPVSVGSGISSSGFGGGNGDDTGRDASARPLGTTSELGSLRVTRAGGVNQHSLAA
ncbi:MAG: hypothetical protein HQ581_24425, partial [Planctomycetes bacterium]|nr:hypothetical protein [Planctomycetota bacterium]